MAEAVANVARRVNATVEEGKSTLDLSNCKLISFPEGVFKVLRSVVENIHTITLADNEIKAVSSKFFATFTNLKELDLQGNVLTKLPDAVGDMIHLTSINLAKNKFSVFPEKLTDIATLEVINLEENVITGLRSQKHAAALRSATYGCSYVRVACWALKKNKKTPITATGEIIKYVSAEVD